MWDEFSLFPLVIFWHVGQENIQNVLFDIFLEYVCRYYWYDFQLLSFLAWTEEATKRGPNITQCGPSLLRDMSRALVFNQSSFASRCGNIWTHSGCRKYVGGHATDI